MRQSILGKGFRLGLAAILIFLGCRASAEQAGAEAAPVEVGEVEEIDHSPFLAYLSREAKSPAEYVISKFEGHDVVILGEQHEVRENCELISGLIEPLYRRAGVRYFATEFMKSKNSALANQLVTGREYDDSLALRLFRDLPQPWGFKEYMDILRAIWTLNNSLPENVEKMRILGLDSDWDAYDDLYGPEASDPQDWWLARERHMTSVLDEEVLEKGAKALAHMGNAHALTAIYARPTLGRWLREKYGDRVFQIWLHQHLLSKSGRKGLTPLIEAIMEKNGSRPVGFDVAGSPFSPLREHNSPYFHPSPDLVLSDVAMGYIFLKPLGATRKIAWVRGFIDESNFERVRRLALARGWIREWECTTAWELDAKLAQLFESR